MASHKKKEILSPSEYDNDAASFHSASDLDSDSEDDSLVEMVRSNRRPNHHDRTLLLQEEERDRLLSRSEPFEDTRPPFTSINHEGAATKISKREAKRRKHREHGSRGRERDQKHHKTGELMYEMEEGIKDLSSQSSSSSFEADRKRWPLDEKRSLKSDRRRFALVHVFVIAVFAFLAFGAYKASTRFRQAHNHVASTRSNGTHFFAPTTILISLDGFRADFLNRDLTPALNAFVASGVSPRYMLPSFPSVTFPNHFTLVTGLYPESHGVVGNTFWDPKLQEEFYYTDPARSMDPKWWTAEPIWVTAEHQGVRTAIHMWPGSEAHIPDVEPTYLDKFNESEDLNRKVDRVLHWLDLPGDEDDVSAPNTERRPQLIATYVPNVDAMGHLQGPNSTQIRATIADVDSMLTILTEGLFDRNLTEIVNIVIVSDHGMATTSLSRLIQLDDIIDLSLVDHIDGWPLRGLRLKDPERDLTIMYDQLIAESKNSRAFDVYTLETMPDRFHFTNNDRIAPLWVVPKTGWGVVEKADFDIAVAQIEGKTFHPMGMHGYDHEHPLMRAIFIARGPAFPHKPNSRVPAFQNIEVYNIVCDSLGVTPHPNNGTLRLPLQPIGLHSDKDAPAPETPHDLRPGDENTQVEPEDTERPDQSDPAELHDPASAPDENVKEGDEEKQSGGSVEENKSTWWEFVHKELGKAKEWAKELMAAMKNNEHKAKDTSG